MFQNQNICHAKNRCHCQHATTVIPTAIIKRTNWHDISSSYPEPRECLAAFLALSSAEVLAGVKPANLVRLSRRTRHCGRSLYQLWQKHSAELMHNCRMAICVLREDASGILLLMYDQKLLQQRLNGRCSSTFLRSLGYETPDDLAYCLHLLQQRFSAESMPHEIGVFLGYPLKDVAAFIGRNSLVVSVQRLWKIYGHRRRSEQLADIYQHHHILIARQLREQPKSAFTLLGCGSPVGFNLLQTN